jgi:hypothetical protein
MRETDSRFSRAGRLLAPGPAGFRAGLPGDPACGNVVGGVAILLGFCPVLRKCRCGTGPNLLVCGQTVA